MQPKQKLVAGLLGIFLGAWGIHQFYLGDNKKGIIRIVVTPVSYTHLTGWPMRPVRPPDGRICCSG